jgi:hypothetical protein
VLDLFQQFDKRDPAEILPAALPEPIEYKSHRQFVRKVLSEEVDLRARGTEFVGKDEETSESTSYRDRMNANGSPSDTVAAGYKWKPGTELAQETADIKRLKKVA